MNDQINLNKLESTGERFLPEWGGQSALEHLHRYLMACDLANGKDVLDIASGEGYGSFMLSRVAKNVIGVDIADEAVNYAKAKYLRSNLQFVTGSCTRIPLPNASVDLVVSFETIEHHDQHELMLTEIRRVLRPGGVLIISSPDKENFSVAVPQDNPYHVKELYENEFKNLIGTHFKNTSYFGQRVLYGSFIASDSTDSGFINYKKDNASIARLPCLDLPIFWVAVASNCELPRIHSGVFEDSTDGLERLKEVLVDRDSYISHLESSIVDRDNQIACLGQAVLSCDKQIADLNKDLAERDVHIASLIQVSNEHETTIQGLRSSNSWKITAPLRMARTLFNRKIGTYHAHDGENRVTAIGPDAFFTICSKNFLAYARALHRSLQPQYSGSRFFVVLCDRVDGLFDPAKEPFEFIYLEELELPNLEEMAHRYNITEFNTALKPFAFLRLMQEFQFGSIVYLDPDLFFVDRMHEVDQLIANGVEAVLTPHILQPAEDDQIHDRNMLQFGIYNLGFLALRNTPTVREFLQWWGRRLEKDCVIRLEDGLFVDQKWADLLPAFIPGARILHHPGYNVAYWNLPQRKITRKADRWFANDQPLRFVHFSGNKLDDVTTFSRHSQQVTIGNIGVLRELLDVYRQEVYKQGHAFYRSLPYAYSWLGKNGVNLHTPQELDLATKRPENPSPTAGVIDVAVPQSDAMSLLRRRYLILRQAFPIAKRLSGGWVPFVRRAWLAYQRHGWRYVKAKTVELSGFRAPPVMPALHQTDQTSLHDDKSMRLLYMDWAIPKPDQDAGSVMFSLLTKIFILNGFKVTFIPCNLKYEEGYYENLVEKGIEVVVYPAITSIQNWLETNACHFDVCILSRGPVVHPYLDYLKKCAPNLRLIFFPGDLHYLREIRRADVENEEYIRQSAYKLQKQEFELIEKCDLTVTFSTEELYIIREAKPEASLAQLPLIFEEIPGSRKSHEERRDILFIGSFPHKPNVDAVIYFAKSIFPLIRRRIPEVRFKVVGASPPESIMRLADVNGIDILGFVKDLGPIFDSIRLTVAPLRYGAGIKGKIGTSFCYGVPCVGTPIAVEGMSLLNGKNILVGESPEEFASAVFEVYTNEKLWKKLSDQSHKFAAENYSLEAINARVRSQLFSVKNGLHHIHNLVELDSWEAFCQHKNKIRKEYERRILCEQSLLPIEESAYFSSPGFCSICSTRTNFSTSYMYSTGNTPNGRPMPNWREHMQCEHCGLVNRVRAALNLLCTNFYPEKDSSIYITERVTKTFQWLANRYQNLQGSEYFGAAYQSGASVDGIRHEDVMNLSFSDSSFDRILSFDVLEHVPDPERAFREFYRVMKPSGVLIFSVPFSCESKTNIVRASLSEDGKILHHLPAEYHGNPVDAESGALCFQYFGWEVLDVLRAIGFKDARCFAYWSKEQGYLGREQYLFSVTK